MKPLLAVVGPTASGKSRCALQIAQALGGEIINADSRQVYRYMEIGTGKPAASERALVPHHLLDIVEPGDAFSLADYRQRALEAIQDITTRGRLPVLVGGTGLYVWTILEGWQVPAVPPNASLRARLEAVAEKGGASRLHASLARTDPATAARIDPRNVRRVIRALEVVRSTGIPFSRLRSKEPPPFRSFILGLTMPRAELYRRIDRRVDQMASNGLVDEVKDLLRRGYGFDLPPLTGIGYREIGLYLEGKLDLQTALQRTKYRTHQLARRQYAWFRPEDGRIHWLRADQSEHCASACALAGEFVG